MTVMLFKHRNRRPHLTSEQDANQYPRTRSEMSGTCDANYTGFDFALLLCLSTHCPLSEKMSTAGGFIKVLIIVGR